MYIVELSKLNNGGKPTILVNKQATFTLVTNESGCYCWTVRAVFDERGSKSHDSTTKDASVDKGHNISWAQVNIAESNKELPSI